jgi:lipopolysaccharide heptosyltransferase III
MHPDALGYQFTLRRDQLDGAREWLRARGRDETRPLAVLHPGHGGGRQAWPAQCYASATDALVECGFQVALTGDGRERALVAQVVAGTRRAVLPLAGMLRLRELAAVLAQARLFVSVSTGPMHLASALAVPAVTLYGPADLRFETTRWCPYRTPHRAVLSTVPCRCARSRECRDAVCMNGITPASLLEAVDDLIAEVGTAEPTRANKELSDGLDLRR